MQLAPELHDTAASLVKGLLLGVGWIVQLVPSQCSARNGSPTAVHEVAELQDTLFSSEKPSVFGVVWAVQTLPFQRAATVTNLVPLK